MAFSCQICSPPFKFDRVETETTATVSYYIGADQDSCHTYFVNVSLRYYETEEPEYSFAVVKYHIYTEEKTHLHSGRHTRDLFSKQEKQLILFIIVEATAELLRWRRPSSVFRCTEDANLPEKATLKHDMVSWVFTREGYTVTPFDDVMDVVGQRMWRAVLQEVLAPEV